MGGQKKKFDLTRKYILGGVNWAINYFDPKLTRFFASSKLCKFGEDPKYQVFFITLFKRPPLVLNIYVTDYIAK